MNGPTTPGEVVVAREDTERIVAWLGGDGEAPMDVLTVTEPFDAKNNATYEDVCWRRRYSPLRTALVFASRRATWELMWS